MKGRIFVPKFIKELDALATLPEPLITKFEEVLSLLCDLEADVNIARMRTSILVITQHIRECHVSRSYPKRLDGIDLKVKELKRMSVPEYTRTMLLASSCDYLLVLPKAEDWRKDDHLKSALSCALNHGLGCLVPSKAGEYKPISQLIDDKLDGEVVDLFERLFGEGASGSDFPEPLSKSVH